MKNRRAPAFLQKIRQSLRAAMLAVKTTRRGELIVKGHTGPETVREIVRGWLPRRLAPIVREVEPDVKQVLLVPSGSQLKQQKKRFVLA